MIDSRRATMKALTLWQPWATLVAIGSKRIETRSWATQHRGPLAIHAAVTKRADWACYSEPCFSELKAFHYPGPRWLPRGKVIAVCELVDVQPVERVRGMAEPRELGFGNFSDGRYAWMLRNVRRLPVEMPATGQQRLWTWDYSGATEAIQRMIEHGEAQERPEETWED